MLAAGQKQRRRTGELRRFVNTVDLQFQRRAAEIAMARDADWYVNSSGVGVHRARRLQIAVQVRSGADPAIGGAGSTACGPAGSQSVSSSCTGQSCAVHLGAALPGNAHAAGGIDHRLRPQLLDARHRGRGRGQQLQIRRQQRILEIQRHARETGRRAMHQLEELGAGLLLGRDTRSDSGPRYSGRWRACPCAASAPGSARRSRDSAPAPRCHTVAGSSIRNVKLRVSSSGSTRAASAPMASRIPVSKRSSTWVSTRSRSGLSRRARSSSASHSSCMRRASSARKSRNVRRDASSVRAPNSSRGSKPASLLEQRAHVGVHRREAAGVGDALERFEIQLGQIDAIPIEAADQVAHSRADRAEALAIGQVHQLAPIQLRVLQHGGLLAPFRVIGPELLADVRQFEPGVHQDALAMAGLDQLLAGTRRPPGRARNCARPRRAGRRSPPCASAPRSSPRPPACGRRNRRRPTGDWSGRAAPGRDRPARSAGRGSARSRARRAARPPTGRRPRRASSRRSSARRSSVRGRTPARPPEGRTRATRAPSPRRWAGWGGARR